jgi:hypothetical protein
MPVEIGHHGYSVEPSEFMYQTGHAFASEKAVVVKHNDPPGGDARQNPVKDAFRRLIHVHVDMAKGNGLNWHEVRRLIREDPG